jgi:hypothetical protein
LVEADNEALRPIKYLAVRLLLNDGVTRRYFAFLCRRFMVSCLHLGACWIDPGTACPEFSPVTLTADIAMVHRLQATVAAVTVQAYEPSTFISWKRDISPEGWA